METRGGGSSYPGREHIRAILVADVGQVIRSEDEIGCPVLQS